MTDDVTIGPPPRILRQARCTGQETEHPHRLVFVSPEFGQVKCHISARGIDAQLFYEYEIWNDEDGTHTVWFGVHGDPTMDEKDEEAGTKWYPDR